VLEELGFTYREDPKSLVSKTLQPQFGGYPNPYVQRPGVELGIFDAVMDLELIC
jgi:hypothetical protein